MFLMTVASKCTVSSEPSLKSGVIPSQTQQMEFRVMLYWSLVFLVVALIAAIFGFSGIAAASAGVARVLFGLFLILFVASFVFQLLQA